MNDTGKSAEQRLSELMREIEEGVQSGIRGDPGGFARAEKASKERTQILSNPPGFRDRQR